MPQRVLITAGANGICLAIVKTFAADGARVHIADVNQQVVNEVTKSNKRITVSVTDVSNPDAVKRIFEDLESALGGRASDRPYRDRGP